MKTCIVIGVIVAATTVATDPVGLPWQHAAAATIILAITGSLFELQASQKVYPLRAVIGLVGLSAIAAMTFFAFIRVALSDSIQTTVLSAVSGIYGRRALEKVASKTLAKFGLIDDEQRTGQ